jgi:hypothetical protein
MSAVATVGARPVVGIEGDALWSREERTLLRWGGVAGLLGGVLFIAVFVIVGAFIGADPSDPAGAVARFPDIRVGRTVENGLYLVILVLWTIHALALHRALRKTGAVLALFGTGVLLLGLGVLAVGAVPHAATAPIAELYRAAANSPQDQAMLVPVWQATQAMFNALLVEGLVILPIGLVLLGLAMRGTPSFGRGLGLLGLALGIATGIAAVVLLVDPMSAIAMVGVFALIVFHLAVGWRLVRLSQAAGTA